MKIICWNLITKKRIKIYLIRVVLQNSRTYYTHPRRRHYNIIFFLFHRSYLVSLFFLVSQYSSSLLFINIKFIYLFYFRRSLKCFFFLNTSKCVFWFKASSCYVLPVEILHYFLSVLPFLVLLALQSILLLSFDFY